MTAKKNPNHYIDNEDYREELIKSHQADQVTPKLLKMFELQVAKQMSEFTYRDDEDRKDIAQSTLLVVLKKWRECDVTREKPFAWFTRVIYNAMYWHWRKMYNKVAKNSVSLSQVFDENV